MNHFDMELTQRQAREYQRAAKKQKGDILTRYCRLTEVSRNLASKRFGKVARDIKPRVLKKAAGKRPGRKPKYAGIHKAIIRQAWELSGEICGERLHPVLGEYVRQLEKSGALKRCGERYIHETETVSPRTLKRIIAGFPKAGRRRDGKGNAAIYKAIPINAHFGANTDKPGYVEIDYVEHNGGSSSGTFAHTGSYVDVCLGWLARAAALGKSQEGVNRIHVMNEGRIFHKVKEYHPDNAKPILKLLLERRLDPEEAGRRRDYRISRSRPYHKEDNGHVEQKNGDKVRKLVGYHRYDTEEQAKLLNRLYKVEDAISNFFLPSQKLVGKVVDDKGRVISRRHDKAKTAYARLIRSPKVSREIKDKITAVRGSLSLVELRKQSEQLQKQLFATVVSGKNIMA